MKPGFSSKKVLEACKTKLIYLGDNLFGELHRKPVRILLQPHIDLGEVQEACHLHRDPNLLEMYIEHISSSDLNASNTHIVRGEQTYVSPTDVTHFLPSQPSIFDADYIPESKVEPTDNGAITSFAITESLGSTLGEIVFPVPVKQELPDSEWNIISTHSPTYQLRLQIANTYSLNAGNIQQSKQTDVNSDSNNDWSLDANPESSQHTDIGLSVSSGQGSQESTPSPTQGLPSNATHTIGVTVSAEPDSSASKGNSLQELTPNIVVITPLQSSSSSGMSEIPSQYPTDLIWAMQCSQEVTISYGEDTSSQELSNSDAVLCSQEVTPPQQMTHAQDTHICSQVLMATSVDSHDAIDSQHSQELSSLIQTVSQEDVLQELTSKTVKSPNTSVPITNGSTSGNLQPISIANNDNIKTTPNQDLSALRMSASYPSQEVTTVDPLDDSSDTIIMDPLESQEPQDHIKTTRIKKQLSNMGLPQSVFEVNKNKYFLTESTIDEDVNFLHFTDILDKSCSVTLDNLSQDDITFEKGLLKTSSPIHSPSTQTSTDTGDTETEKCDPTFGKTEPVKKSMRPYRAPSATRIAAQKCIQRTKGFTKTLPSIQQLKNTAPCSSKTAKDKTVTNKTTVSKDNERVLAPPKE